MGSAPLWAALGLRFALEILRKCFVSLSFSKFSAPSRLRSAAGLSVLGEAQKPGEGQKRKRRGDGRGAEGLADHAPAPRKRRRLAPSTMRRPPARNRRKPHSGARRRMVEAEMPETCAACCKVKEIAPGFGAGRFLESLGIV